MKEECEIICACEDASEKFCNDKCRKWKEIGATRIAIAPWKRVLKK